MENLVSLISFKNVVDIVLVAVIIFYAYRLLRKSGAVNLFWGLLAFVAVWFVTAYVFHLNLTGALFNRIVSVGAFAIIVIFQQEIRNFFYHVGSHMGKGLPWKKVRRQQDSAQLVQALEQALLHMSDNKTGALIVLTGKQDLSEYADSGEPMDAIVSTRLIENIFFKNSPLHDGALIMTDSRLRSAACILPVSDNKDLPLHYGLRHRAALGLTEKTDATAWVVSEETGEISLSQGSIIRPVQREELAATLAAILTV